MCRQLVCAVSSECHQLSVAHRDQTSVPFVSFALCIQTAGREVQSSDKSHLCSVPAARLCSEGAEPTAAPRAHLPPRAHAAVPAVPLWLLPEHLPSLHDERGSTTWERDAGRAGAPHAPLTPPPLLAEWGPPSPQPSAPALPGTATGHTVAVTWGRGASLDRASEPGPNPNRCPTPRQPQLLIRPWQHHAPAGEAVVSAGLEGAGARGAGMCELCSPRGCFSSLPSMGPPGP